MRVLQLSAALVAVAVSLSGCQSSPGGNASLETDTEKASYGYGVSVARSLGPAAERVDLDAFVQGLQDVVADRELAVSTDSLQAVIQRFVQGVRDEQSQANLEAGEAFLEQNAAKEGVTVTESGLQYEVLEEGSGARPQPEDEVRILYTGMLPDGTEFDSSGETPASFTASQFIPGFTEGLLLMPEGSRYRFVIPSDIAYGQAGAGQGAIEPNQTLVFEVELVEIVEE